MMVDIVDISENASIIIKANENPITSRSAEVCRIADWEEVIGIIKTTMGTNPKATRKHPIRKEPPIHVGRPRPVVMGTIVARNDPHRHAKAF